MSELTEEVGELSLVERYPTGASSVQVVGGENLFHIASHYLNDASQWWRIADLNRFPGEPPDFIVSVGNVRTFPTLLIPPVNQNASPQTVLGNP